MISHQRFGELERMIGDAEAEGAEVCCGGARWRHVYFEEGAYFEGTVIGGIEPNMEISQRECERKTGASLADFQVDLYLQYSRPSHWS